MSSKKTVCIAVILSILMLSTMASAIVSQRGSPKFDEIRYKVIKESEAVKNALLAGEVDMIRGPGRAAWINEIQWAGFNITFDDEATFSALFINCRDTYPVEVIGGSEGKSPGDPVAPLNDNVFRVSLQYIWGMDRKNASIFDYVQGDWIYGIHSPVPPAQKPWFNPTVTLPESDNTTAWTLLQAVGYYVNATDNRLYNPDGTPMRDLNVLYSSGATFWQYVAGGFVESFNNFMSYIGATDGPTMTLVGKAFTTLNQSMYTYHDFDIVATEFTGLGRFVDWLYDLLHSDNIVGIVDSEFDELTETIVTSVDHDEVKNASWQVQERFINFLYPWIPVASSKAIVTFHPDLVNFISMPIYSSLNDWTWNLMHWPNYVHPTLGTNTLRFALGVEPSNLNPLYEDIEYGWDILDRAFTGLITLEPYNLTDMPYVALNWKAEPWVSIPELGITNGTKVTFWLRQDLKWHDGKPVTADDCVYALRLMREYQPDRYSSVWEDLVYEEAEGPYKLVAYYSRMSLYYQYYVASATLFLPPQIWKIAEEFVANGTWEDLRAFDPAAISYKDWTGEDPPAKYPFMKALVGTGAYVFDYYDRSLMVGRVQKFDEYFINETGILAGVDVEYRNEPDTPSTYDVIVQNVGAKDDATGELTSVTVDIEVLEDGVSVRNATGITLDPFSYETLGPYTTSSLSAGPHDIEVIVTGSAELDRYKAEIASTIVEDINFDFKVDIRDIAIAARAFGTFPGHPDWNPDADIAGPLGRESDYKVDIRDIATIARQFGWTA